MIGLGVGPARGLGRGDRPGGLATPPALPRLPAARWHPARSGVALSGGRVVSATDLQGLADVAEAGSGIGPRALTDALGRKFWRFEGAEALSVATGLVCDTRDMSAFLVGRVPRPGASINRFLSLGSVAAGTRANTLNGPLEGRVLSQSVGHLQSFGKVATSAASGSEWMVPGAQLQVMGMTSSASGTRLFLNERHVDVAAAYPVAGVAGAEIGRYSWSTGAPGSWGVFDLYDMVVFSPALSAAGALEVSEALMAEHAIAPVEHQLVLEGDSITMGTGDVTAALSCAAVLSDPGAGHVPPGWRVVNRGIGGNQIGDLVSRRDTAHGWAEETLPGQNVMAFEIGRNDFSGSVTAQQHYDAVVAYLNTAGTGVLQRGWTVRAMANIASSSSIQAKIDLYRAMLRDPQFLADTASGDGQAFDGKVSVIPTDLIEHDGERRFLDTDDATNTTYYAGDVTHPSVLGARVRVTGGDTPHFGVAAGL